MEPNNTNKLLSVGLGIAAFGMLAPSGPCQELCIGVGATIISDCAISRFKDDSGDDDI